MKILILLMIIFLLSSGFGCAYQNKIKAQEWNIAFLKNEIDILENEITKLSNLLEQEKINKDDLRYLIKMRFGLTRIRMQWMNEKYEKVREDFNTEMKIMDE